MWIILSYKNELDYTLGDYSKCLLQFLDEIGSTAIIHTYNTSKSYKDMLSNSNLEDIDEIYSTDDHHSDIYNKDLQYFVNFHPDILNLYDQPFPHAHPDIITYVHSTRINDYKLVYIPDDIKLTEYVVFGNGCISKLMKYSPIRTAYIIHK